MSVDPERKLAVAWQPEWDVVPTDVANAAAHADIDDAQEHLTYEAAKEDMDERVARGLTIDNFDDAMSSRAWAGGDASGLDQDFYHI